MTSRSPSSDPAAIELASDGFRVQFFRTGDGRYRFMTDGASLPNVLVGGGLDLAADTVGADADGLKLTGRGQGKDPAGAPVDYTWSGTVQPCAGSGLAFEATVDLAGLLADPPAIELWLGPLSTMADRQALTWRRTFAAGPVRNTQGLAGNSVPAAYLLDATTGIETMFHVDAGFMAWAPGRLLGVEMQELFDHGPTARYGIGLLPRARFTLPAGRHEFRWRLWQRRADGTPDAWQAGARLVDRLAADFDGGGQWLDGPVTWERVAAGTVADLLDADQIHVVARKAGEDEALGLRAYVRDAPRIYEPPPDTFELMTLADVVPPLLLYLRLHPDDETRRLAVRLAASLSGFGHPEADFVSNRYPTDGVEETTDTWYFFLNGLIKVPWVAVIEGDDGLGRVGLAGLRGAERLADATSDRLPRRHLAVGDPPAAGGTPTAARGPARGHRALSAAPA